MSVGNDEALARYKQYMIARGFSRFTVQAKTSVLGRLALFARKAGVDLLDMDSRLIQNWLASLFESRARDTVKDYFKIARVFFKWAIAEGLASINPLEGLETPSAPPKPVEPYSPAEVRALLAASGGREHLWILMLVSTGLRGSELAGIRVEEIDFEEETLRVWNGKGHKERVILLRPDAATALKAEIEGNKRWHGYVWPARGRLGHIGENTIYHLLQEVAWRAKVPHFKVHKFRNTFACRFLERGGAVNDLAILLGHSTMAMSLHYATWTAQGRALAAQRRFNGLNDDEGDDNELRSTVRPTLPAGPSVATEGVRQQLRRRLPAARLPAPISDGRGPAVPGRARVRRLPSRPHLPRLHGRSRGSL